MYAWLVLGTFVVVASVQQPPWWHLVPGARIGEIDGPASLTEITELAVDSNGDLYVLSSQDAAIKVFSPSGKLKTTIGKRGQGPGEFLGPTRHGFINGSLWVNDPDLFRTTFIHPASGEVKATVRMPSSSDLSLGRFRLLGMLSDSAFVGMYTWTANTPDGQPLPLLYRHVGGAERILTHLPAGRSIFAVRNVQFPTKGYFSRQPFDDSPITLYAPGRRQVVIISRQADKPPVKITWLNAANGKVVRAKHYNLATVPIPRFVKDSIVNAQVAAVLRSRGADISSRATAEKRIRAVMFLPKHLPPVTAAFVDGLDRIWIRREDRRTQERVWQVVDNSGVIVGQVRLPKSVVLLAATATSVWGSTYDDLDVAYVRRYDIKR